MKNAILLAAALLLVAATPFPYRVSVMTDPDGRITHPTNFFSVNSNLIAQALPAGLGEGTGVTDGVKGDIVVSSDGQVWGILNGAITGLKLESVGVTPGVYHNPITTIDIHGRVIAIQSGSAAAVDTEADFDWKGRHSFVELDTPEIFAGTVWITNSFGVYRLYVGEAIFTNALKIASGGTGGRSPQEARENLGLVINENVQGFSPNLSALDQSGYLGDGAFLRQSAGVGSGTGGFNEAGIALTTGATQTTLWSGAIPANSSVEYFAEVIGGGATNTAGYRVAATMANRGGVGSTVEIATIKESETSAGMSAAFTRSGTTASLAVEGMASENIRWNWGVSYRVVANASGGADSAAPTVSGAVVPSAGTSIALTFNETVQFGAGGSAGFTLTASGGAVSMINPSGAGTSTITYQLSRTLRDGEVVTISYAQPGNGIEDIVGNDLASFSDAAVDNLSAAEESGGECSEVFASYSGTINGSTGLGYSWNRTHISQLRIADKTGTICGTDLLFIPRKGAPAYGMRVEIWSHNEETAKPGERIGIASDSVLASEVSTTDPTWLEFRNMSALVTEGQKYHEVLISDGLGDLDNYVSWARYSSLFDNSIMFGGGTGTWTLSSSSRRSISISYYGGE